MKYLLTVILLTSNILCAQNVSTRGSFSIHVPTIPLIQNPIYNAPANFYKDPAFIYTSGTNKIFFSYVAQSSSVWNIAKITTVDFISYTNQSILFINYAAPSTPVLKNGVYYLFFQSYPDDIDITGHSRIFYSSSSDLITWSDPTFIFDKTSTPWKAGEFRVIDPEIILDGSTYYMYYVAHDSNNQNAIGYATTSTTDFPSNWIDQTPITPIIRDNTYSWETGVVEAPYIIKFGITYYLFYTGGLDSTQGQSEGYATTTDLNTAWTKHDQIAINFRDYAWSSHSYGQVYILPLAQTSFSGSAFYMIFQGNTSDATNWKLGLAKSDNLISWIPTSIN